MLLGPMEYCSHQRKAKHSPANVDLGLGTSLCQLWESHLGRQVSDRIQGTGCRHVCPEVCYTDSTLSLTELSRAMNRGILLQPLPNRTAAASRPPEHQVG